MAETASAEQIKLILHLLHDDVLAHAQKTDPPPPIQELGDRSYIGLAIKAIGALRQKTMVSVDEFLFDSLDLRGLNLGGADLEEQSLSATDFTSAKLWEANLTSA